MKALTQIRDSWMGCQLGDNWWLSKDGDPYARYFFDQHYSRRKYKDGRRPKLFVGPGYKLVLVRPAFAFASPPCEIDSLLVWRDCLQDDGEVGTCCSIFRNESPVRSSELILEAEEILRASGWEWFMGDTSRVFTYVDPGKVASSNPGCCFKMAGWKRSGVTGKGLLVFEKFL